MVFWFFWDPPKKVITLFLPFEHSQDKAFHCLLKDFEYTHSADQENIEIRKRETQNQLQELQNQLQEPQNQLQELQNHLQELQNHLQEPQNPLKRTLLKDPLKGPS